MGMFKAPVPAKLPHLHTILDELGLPDKQVAHFLDVTPKTVDRWRKSGQAPRPVMLALFWESRWGQSAANCEAVNYGRMQYMQCLALKLQIRRMQTQIDKLEHLLDESGFSSANAPFFDAR